MGSNYVWSLDGIAAEEDGEVETDNVIVALHGVKLNGETTGVASFIRVLTTNGDCGESDEDRSLFTYAGEEVGFLEEIFSIFQSESDCGKHTVRESTFLVHSKYPNAPEPQGCTIRSRFLERLKVCCFWKRNTSLATGMPPIVLLCALQDVSGDTSEAIES